MSKPASIGVFRTPIPLRWSDMDAFNHVNNSRYLTFLEQARIEWFETIGEPWVTEDSAPVVASATLNFKRPIEYPAEVFVELFTEKLGNSSVVIGHRIVDADGGLHCDGSVVAVWIDRHSSKPTPLPAGVRRASELLLETPAA
ncbi:thioesterase family protein [Thermomonas sp. HDW16]|uniref:acyl-CoA thioesterase n=1 Tax=Thermomonas sp. HDW16 TaxID=2714945 RepID=UPI00140AB037|nr:thioesterase family protein [Thermomonas sp. HDW16]QIL20344.1 acyl-CoA thioesterase [Thermomonas sp. HDW16]